MHDKLPQSRHNWGHVTPLKFWTPVLYLEWVQPGASNLIHRLSMERTSLCVINYPPKRRG